jgi:hypothetical protein
MAATDDLSRSQGYPTIGDARYPLGGGKTGSDGVCSRSQDGLSREIS